MVLTAALRRRLATAGTAPLITYYEGENRTELSAVTFANWVDKTANLIVDLGHEDGEPIDLLLAASHPAHWVTLVWIAAAWQRGCPVKSELTGADLLVIGPQHEQRAETTVACSLHPLGMGLPEPLPGVVDYREVLAQPDLHDASFEVLRDVFDGEEVTSTPRDDRRLFVDPQPGTDTLRDVLCAPILGTGSSVVAVATFNPTAIATAERATRGLT